jgi:hypothetical protein
MTLLPPLYAWYQGCALKNSNPKCNRTKVSQIHQLLPSENTGNSNVLPLPDVSCLHSLHTLQRKLGLRRATIMFRSISNFIGGGQPGSGEVAGYENAPYTVTNTFEASDNNYAVLRIRIPDPVPFCPLDPGSGMGKKSGSGHGIRDPG